MRFNAEKYLTINRNKELGDNLGITPDCFDVENELKDQIEKHGEINNVRYSVTTGIIESTPRRLVVKLGNK